MERTCGKCKGQGGFAKRRTTSLSQFVSGDTGWVKCSVCGGSGVNPSYREKGCERCGRTIGYHKDANYPPKYCPNCKEAVAREKAEKQRERERQNAMWQEKRCSGYKGQYCSNTIRYRVDWSKSPDLCPSCIEKAKADKAQQAAMWKEKRCSGYKGQSCSNIIKYRIDWNKIPDLCPDCIAKAKAEKAKWLEKPCAGEDCNNTIRYRTDWEHPPSFCQSCKDKRKDKVEGLHSKRWTNKRGDVGKVLRNDDEPDIETHLHKHKDGITISTYRRDPDTGEMKPKERYNFNTGEDESPKD
jgi:hypothetical protein